jgi:hypothetical protein
MIPIDEDEPSKMDLVDLIKSQCLNLTDSIFSIDHHIELLEWLKENAGERMENIPFIEAENGYLPDIKDKWGSFFSATEVIYWIQNKRVRFEFAMRWL